jgi:hypothetical protein
LKLRGRVGVLTDTVEQWDKQPTPKDADEAWTRVCDSYRRIWRGNVPSRRGSSEELFSAFSVR